MLTAPKGGAWVKSGAGEDTLIGGLGADTLEGGAGADLYIPLTGGPGKLVLQGFDPQQDRIDLSGFALLHGVEGLSILATASGALIRIGTTEINLIAGRSLTAAEVTAALVFNSDHLLASDTIMPASHATDDSSGAFRFLYSSGPQSYLGSSASDCLSYAAAPSGAVVNLANQSLNAGSALGHILTQIENLEGSGFNDNFTGDGHANGLYGGAGNDWITPGAGNDTVDGGSGVDMVSFVDAAVRVVVDLGAHSAQSGGATKEILNIENVTGSVFSDLITGDAGANRLRGLGDYDWFVGSGGGDTFEGGTGRDTVAYSAATAGVSASLLAKAGSLGQAMGDHYDSIENLTGSSYADQLSGDNDRNILRGLAGDDFIFGLDGNDTIDGGAGRDTIDGGRGNDRITGGRGNDAMDGGLGWDTAIYSGKKADYTITHNADNSITVLNLAGGADGVDVLLNVEALQFSDGRLYL